MINNMITNNQIDIQKCYLLDNDTLINNNHYYYISLLAGIGSFFIGNYLIKCFYKLRNNNNNEILIASQVNN
tara:strand:+ start:1566 stop:1781 length:216 start_codon:yes stop_codon:yes gene_type:complete